LIGFTGMGQPAGWVRGTTPGITPVWCMVCRFTPQSISSRISGLDRSHLIHRILVDSRIGEPDPWTNRFAIRLHLFAIVRLISTRSITGFPGPC
jgi:hypothetical protein